VTARGMDFPGVTHVIQIGLPPNRDQYIHRVGRTGRGSASGEGWVFFTNVEMGLARSMLRALPLAPDKSLQAAYVDMTNDAQLPASVAETLSQVGDATKMVGGDVKAKAYLAAIGERQSVNDKQALIDTLNQWTRYGWGWETPPSVSPTLAQRLGLSRVRGLETGRSPRSDDFGGDREGRSGGYGNDRGGRSRDFGGDRGGRSGGYGGDRRGRSGDFGGDRGRSSYGNGGRGGYDRGAPRERTERASF